MGGIEHGAWSRRETTRGRGETARRRLEVRGRKSEIREKTTGVRFSHIEILLWERLSSRDLIDIDNTMDSNRNQRLLLHDLYQLTAFL